MLNCKDFLLKCINLIDENQGMIKLAEINSIDHSRDKDASEVVIVLKFIKLNGTMFNLCIRTQKYRGDKHPIIKELDFKLISSGTWDLKLYIDSMPDKIDSKVAHYSQLIGLELDTVDILDKSNNKKWQDEIGNHSLYNCFVNKG